MTEKDVSIKNWIKGSVSDTGEVTVVTESLLLANFSETGDGACEYIVSVVLLVKFERV